MQNNWKASDKRIHKAKNQLSKYSSANPTKLLASRPIRFGTENQMRWWQLLTASNESGKVKYELQVMSYEFKSTSYEFKCTSYEFKSTS